MLSQTQREARKGRLTASRVACLMEGDVNKIDRLYREMIGEAEPEDLSHVWAVRLGEVTEQLQLNWFEQKNGTLVTRRGEVVIHPQISWATCTLDGWCPDLNCPIECKHTGGREPFDPVIIDRYQPQIQWQMLVTNATQCALSVIMGANQPIVEFIERRNPYIAEMVLRGKQFMDCVTFGRPPAT
jgi:predicted phage-related endonuclease